MNNKNFPATAGRRKALLAASSLALGALLPATRAFAAEDGVSADTILLGQSAVLSGPQAGTALDGNRAALAYFDRINTAGGVYGRRIKLISLDDELKPEKAIANYRRLIDEQRVFATFAGLGTATTAAAIPLLNDRKVPLIAPSGVADSVRAMPTRQVYYLRAGYMDESAKLVDHITSLGQREIGMAALNNPGGKEMLANVQGQLGKLGITLKSAGMVDGDGNNAAAVAKQIATAAPQAVLVFVNGKLSGDFVKLLLDNNYRGQLYCFSIASAELVAREAGARSRGIGFTQVTQYPWDSSVKVVKEYQQLAGGLQAPVTYNGMAGHIAARLLVEALQRAGKDLTREKLRTALESAPYDIGGVPINFSPTDHVGTRSVELVMLSRDAKIVR